MIGFLLYAPFPQQVPSLARGEDEGLWHTALSVPEHCAVPRTGVWWSQHRAASDLLYPPSYGIVRFGYITSGAGPQL
jgi:hypothetical protein